MTIGNLVAFLAMGIVVWAVFAIFGSQWETQHARLVAYTPHQVSIASMPEEAPLLPDRVQVGSISGRPASAN